MKQNINAEVVSIGTEILLGELTDTNSVFIAQVLRDLGINLYFMTSVGDNRQRIAQVLRNALSRADVVITCGGLGPTVDDMTRQAVADASERDLVFHQSLLDQIAARFAGFRVQMTENNRQQAYLPADAILIENPTGTAPAFAVAIGEKLIISLPGVPREMKYLMMESVVPLLRDKYNLGIIKSRILRTAGIGESTLDDMIGRALLEQANPTVGLAAHNGQVDVRITAKAESLEDALAMLDSLEAQVRERVGKHIYGYDKAKLEEIVLGQLAHSNARVTVIESGIDSGLRTALALPDIENVIHENYDTVEGLLEAAQIGSEGALRERVAQAAQAFQSRYQSSAAIVIVSKPEVDEGADNTESTAVAVAVGERIRSRSYGFGAMAEISRVWVRMWALSALWGMLQESIDNA